MVDRLNAASQGYKLGDHHESGRKKRGRHENTRPLFLEYAWKMNCCHGKKAARLGGARHMPEAASNILSAPWGRRGVIASLLVGLGTLAAKSFSWFHFPQTDRGDYQVIAEWQVAAGGKGLMIAISPHSTLEELRAVGSRLREQFRRLDNAAVMIFDDAEAARLVRKGSRKVDEARFQAALLHQRAMYLKSLPRGEESFTIYKSYPVVNEVMRFNEGDLRKTIG